jgi:hypothetical protein
VAPAPGIVELVARHKAAILALLRSADGGWSALDWLKYREARTRVATEHGLTGLEAEVRALDCCIVEWLNQHPAPSAAESCAWCGRSESQSALVLPFGTEPGGHTWLHAECWRAWHRARRADAMKALAAMGVTECSAIHD